jgi:mono/diheme cytochrome c family protein
MPRPLSRRQSSTVLIGVALTLIALWSILPAAQGRPPSPKRATLKPISSIDGKDLYDAYCAQCHGSEGKGDGPAAAGLKAAPADLTQLAAKNGGKYNRTAVEAFIKGDRPGAWMVVDDRGKPMIMTANGPDEMPAWGIIFRYMWSDQPIVIRCGNLAQYIGKLQAK